jgi:hypothetical protein
MARVSAALLLVPSLLAAQASSVRVVIADSLGNRVPFAVVQVDPRTRRAANDSGVVYLETAAADSIKLSIRRIGFAPFDGWAIRTADGAAYAVRLVPLPQALKEVQIRSVSENRLYRSGFYGRMEERMKITARANFITPEELEDLNADQVTTILRRVDFLRINRENITGGAASYDMANVVTGRGRCTANILLDGQIPAGLVEEVFATDVATTQSTSLPNSGGDRNRATRSSGPIIPIDQVIQPGSIAGIEIYQMASGAPPELRTKVKRANCPLIAIWSGARR